MFVLGITGPSGAGKSLACGCLKKHGFLHLNADLTARSVVEKGKPCLEKLVDAFGKTILNPDGALNRSELARLAFSGGKVDLLDKITHPYIIDEIEYTLKSMEKKGAEKAVLDAPTLFESGADKFCNKILFITASKNTRIKRIIERDNISFSAASSRIEAQPSDDYYMSRSDFTVFNDGDSKELESKIDNILKTQAAEIC